MENHITQIRVMKRSTIALSVAALIGTVPALAQQEFTADTPGINGNSLCYYLPRTVLTATVTVKHTTYTPGEFGKYAERYLRIDPPAQSASDTWEITQISLIASGQPDMSHMVVTNLPKKGSIPMINIDSNGIISSVGVIETQAVPSAPAVALPQPTARKKSGNDYLTEEILQASSTTKMAELTARDIMEIRESRNAISRGQAEFMPDDGETMRYMIEFLNEQEEALVSLFTGTTEVSEKTYRIEVIPGSDISKSVLFRFSTKLGLLAADNLAGAPVWIDIEQKQEEIQSPDLESNGAVKEKSKSGIGKKETPFLYYRIPGKARIRIYDNTQEFVKTEESIAQFGILESIPESVFTKGEGVRITFNRTTGGISSFER